MKVHVIIVGWNGDDWLPDCLTSLAGASVDRLHLVLVDNHNNPCIPDLDVSAFQTTILKTPKPMGFAEANNYALVHADWKEDGLVLFLNQDTRSAAGWIDRCLACFQQSPELGALSPGVRTLEDDDWDAAYKVCAKDTRSMPGMDWQSVHEITAAAMLVRASVLRKVGPFDPIFESYYEDYDLCRRIREAGSEVGICPDAHLYHFNGSITRDVAAERRRMRWIARNRIITRIRESGDDRIKAVLKNFLVTLPINLARGVARRPSAQPVGVSLQVIRDLIRLSPRLVSASTDDAAWQKYLQSIGWQ
ncbi:MAG: N-acetylglucosaminyl-diphospho-decaprenol L-rhamnosyltransferase [Candidatus Omnitrophota bacterium]|jgi:N-acetylglucosaminyl-diphospho-decaprenol L-rhamnosyltransferase